MLHVTHIPDNIKFSDKVYSIKPLLKTDDLNYISPEVYWTSMLREAIYETGYIPTNLYYLITTSTILQSYITSDIVKSWYREDIENLNTTIREILYTSNINIHYFSQSGSGIRELEDLIKEYYDIKYINYLSDTNIEVIL